LIEINKENVPDTRMGPGPCRTEEKKTEIIVITMFITKMAVDKSTIFINLNLRMISFVIDYLAKFILRLVSYVIEREIIQLFFVRKRTFSS
jgi:hypothetical protein